jgi:hypothetical protein
MDFREPLRRFRLVYAYALLIIDIDPELNFGANLRRSEH